MSLFKRSSLIIFIVFTISVILLALSTYYSYREKRQLAEKMQQTYDELKIIGQALYNFRSDTGNLPKSENGLILLYKNTGLKGWAGPYIQKEKMSDLWGKPYKYENHLKNDLPSFIASFGKNKTWDSTISNIRKKKATKDDIIIWIE